MRDLRYEVISDCVSRDRGQVGRLEVHNMGTQRVFYLDGRLVPRSTDLELHLRGKWLRGRFAYPAFGGDRPTFTVCIEYPGRHRDTEESLVTIGVDLDNLFRWPA